MWEVPVTTGLVFAVGLAGFFLVGVVGYPFITLVAYALLCVILLAGPASRSPSALRASSPPPSPPPPVPQRLDANPRAARLACVHFCARPFARPRSGCTCSRALPTGTAKPSLASSTSSRSRRCPKRHRRGPPARPAQNAPLPSLPPPTSTMAPPRAPLPPSFPPPPFPPRPRPLPFCRRRLSPSTTSRRRCRRSSRRAFQHSSEMTPRRFRDDSETTPRCFRDGSEAFRDGAETTAMPHLPELGLGVAACRSLLSAAAVEKHMPPAPRPTPPLPCVRRR